MSLELELNLDGENLSVNDIKSFLLNHPPFESGVLKNFHFLSEAECAVENAIGNVLKVVLILEEREYKITYNLLETKLKDRDIYTVYHVVDTIVNSKPIKKTNIYSTVYNPKVSDDFVQALFDAQDKETFFPMWETTAINSDNPDTFTYNLAMLIDWAISEYMSEEDISELTHFYEVENIVFAEFPREECEK